MWPGLDATIYVEKPTTFEYIEGDFFVNNYIGAGVIRCVYKPQIFLPSLLGAEQAMAAWQAEQQGQAINVHQLYPVARLASG